MNALVDQTISLSEGNNFSVELDHVSKSLLNNGFTKSLKFFQLKWWWNKTNIFSTVVCKTYKFFFMCIYFS